MIKNIIKKITKSIIYIVLIIILLIILVQRFTNNEKSLLGYKIFRVATESMVPEYYINDVILVQEVDLSEIKENDNITYLGKIEDGIQVPITHKVIKIEESEEGNLIFHTKGIVNDIEDPIVKEEQIYGVVIFKMHILSFINRLINNIFGFILLIFVPLMFWICKNIKELILMVKEKTDEG